MIHSNILPLPDTRRNSAISGRTATPSFESERSTSYHQMDEYVRKTILSRYDFGSGALSIVQDNARTTCYCTPPSQEQVMCEKKLKNNNRRRKNKCKNHLSSKKSQNMNNKIASRRPCRWGSSSSVHAINDEGLQSQHTTNSNNRRFPGRWSNGMTDFKGKEELDQQLFATATTSVMENLAVALAKDPSLSSQITTSHADIRSLPRGHTGQRLHSSLNSAITITEDPRHSLIRPERIPSYDYLNSRRRHRQGHPKNGGQNFRWVQ